MRNRKFAKIIVGPFCIFFSCIPFALIIFVIGVLYDIDMYLIIKYEIPFILLQLICLYLIIKFKDEIL